MIILLALMFLMFQAVYAWAGPPADAPEGLVGTMQAWVVDNIPQNFLRDLVVEGLLAGDGAVVVFLPQILILFLFILLLDASGYMTRAACLMDGLRRSNEHASELRS